MEELNRMFKQWGFVWGENLPTFTMMVIDYDNSYGHGKDPSSVVATRVQRHEEVAEVSDNYSYDKQTGKKFVIPLYGSGE